MQARLEWTGKVVLVTGGTKGIGRCIAETFCDAGAQVVVCARRPPAPSTEPEGLHFVAADVRDRDEADRLIGYCSEKLGRLDVLVNNAGGSPAVETATVSPRFSSSIVDLNLLAPLYLSQQANLVMQAQPTGGVILQIASVSGLRASPTTAAYGAAKAGLINLTQTLGLEWAPKVRVNAIAAGLIATEDAQAHYGDATEQAKIADTIAMGRLGTGTDVAQACLFLASERASYITGAHLVVDGGGERPAYLDVLSKPEP